MSGFYVELVSARLLAQFADPSDIRYDCSDLIEDTMSAFARLMQSEEGMKLWNEFVEKVFHDTILTNFLKKNHKLEKFFNMPAFLHKALL